MADRACGFKNELGMRAKAARSLNETGRNVGSTAREIACYRLLVCSERLEQLLSDFHKRYRSPFSILQARSSAARRSFRQPQRSVSGRRWNRHHWAATSVTFSVPSLAAVVVGHTADFDWSDVAWGRDICRSGSGRRLSGDVSRGWVVFGGWSGRGNHPTAHNCASYECSVIPTTVIIVVLMRI